MIKNNPNSKPPYALICGCCGNTTGFVFLKSDIINTTYCNPCSTSMVELNTLEFKSTRFLFSNIGESNFNHSILPAKDTSITMYTKTKEFKERLLKIGESLNEIKCEK